MRWRYRECVHCHRTKASAIHCDCRCDRRRRWWSTSGEHLHESNRRASLNCVRPRRASSHRGKRSSRFFARQRSTIRSRSAGTPGWIARRIDRLLRMCQQNFTGLSASNGGRPGTGNSPAPTHRYRSASGALAGACSGAMNSGEPVIEPSCVRFIRRRCGRLGEAKIQEFRHVVHAAALGRENVAGLDIAVNQPSECASARASQV